MYLVCFTFIKSDKDGTVEIIIDQTFNSYFKGAKLLPGYAHTVADMDNDFKQDLILVTKSPTSDKPHFEIWTIMTDRSYNKVSEYDPPSEANVYGQSLFADFGKRNFFVLFSKIIKLNVAIFKDSDGEIEHLLPACLDTECKRSVIYVRKFNDKVKSRVV